MKTRGIGLALGATWELLRFVALFAALVIASRSFAPTATVLAGWLLLFGTGQLALIAGYLLAWLIPGKYHGLVGVLILGKALSLFAALLCLFSDAAPALPLSVGGFQPPMAGLLLCGVVAGLDLLFLWVLLASRGPSVRLPATEGNHDTLPELKETELEDRQ